ncbi:DGQHR domain-containing protein [Pseudoalteromonas sp. Xi13]|uniref:DGQHR domain-containing protein n=1 Tax=Pseudoalteromonas sp. Xi13 TaxID=2490635 RepID=UPI000F74E304|nr:DGQHR domain-containing protein [Pseudoalteromonas sp. Xi13]AZN32540.1 DGQHR domain-containing protein [Pseudoalteromonas sp. Xi13]
MREIKKPAFNIGNESVEVYLTAMTAKEIFSFSKVSRVNENPDKGYQRHLNESRAKSIAEYLDSGNIIPGAIILSTQQGVEISYENNELSMTLDNNSLFVIDGQHRLYGSHIAKTDVLLPVCIFNGLDQKAEVQYFIDINSTQKGVPKTLRIELMKFLAEDETSIDTLRSKLFSELGSSPESPLYGRTSATASARGKVTLVPFKDAIDPLLEGDVLSQFSFEDKKKLLINYLSATEGVLEEIDGNNDRLTTSAFFQAIFKIFDKVCRMSLTHHKSYSSSSMKNILTGIKPIDFSKHSGSNQATVSGMAKEFSDLLDIYSKRMGEPTDLL